MDENIVTQFFAYVARWRDRKCNKIMILYKLYYNINSYATINQYLD